VVEFEALTEKERKKHPKAKELAALLNGKLQDPSNRGEEWKFGDI